MKSFKYIVVGVLLVVFYMVKAEINSEAEREIKNLIHGISGSCSEKITAESFVKMIVDHDNHGMDIEAKCYKACALTHMGLMREGKFYTEHIENHLQSIIDTTKSCIRNANDYLHECDVVGAFEKCMKKIDIYQ